MRLLSGLVTAWLICSMTGCSLFKKNTTTPTSTGGGLGLLGPSPPKFPGDPLIKSPSAKDLQQTQAPVINPADTGILAGVVVDQFNRPTGGAYIQYVHDDGTNGGSTGIARPQEVVTDSHGYFTIQNLKPGATYRLVARAKQGEKLVACESYVQATNVRAHLQMREDLVTRLTPALPGSDTTPAVAVQAPRDAKDIKPIAQNPQGWGPSQPATDRNIPGGLGNDQKPAVVPPVTPQTDKRFIPGIAHDPKNTMPPTLSIKGSKKDPAPPAFPHDLPRPPLLDQSKAGGFLSDNPVVNTDNNKLTQLTLHAVSGGTWDFQRDHHGKLLLLDFWSTTCVPCLKSMSELQRVSDRHASHGLEIVGIVMDPANRPRDRQAADVNNICKATKANYKQLFGNPLQRELTHHFSVQAVPTLCLIDQDGTLLWRHTGSLNAETQARLEQILQSKLSLHSAGR